MPRGHVSRQAAPGFSTPVVPAATPTRVPQAFVGPVGVGAASPEVGRANRAQGARPLASVATTYAAPAPVGYVSVWIAWAAMVMAKAELTRCMLPW